MADILLGLFAIIAGAVILFAGQFVLRLVIPIWGFFAGFALGAGLFAGLADERFLGTVLGWISGFVCALIFAVLSVAGSKTRHGCSVSSSIATPIRARAVTLSPSRH